MHGSPSRPAFTWKFAHNRGSCQRAVSSHKCASWHVRRLVNWERYLPTLSSMHHLPPFSRWRHRVMYDIHSSKIEIRMSMGLPAPSCLSCFFGPSECVGQNRVFGRTHRGLGSFEWYVQDKSIRVVSFTTIHSDNISSHYLPRALVWYLHVNGSCLQLPSYRNDSNRDSLICTQGQSARRL